MSDIPTVQEQLTSLASRLEQESGLRASLDRDLGDLTAVTRANNTLLQAIATTQSQHIAVLAEHNTLLARLVERSARLEDGIQAIARQLDTLINRAGDSA